MLMMLALAGLGLLVALGFALRLAVPALGRLLLPVSLIGGAIGLAAGPHGLGLVPRDVLAQWTSLPAPLIAIVFACLFLGAPVPSLAAVGRTAGPLVRFSVLNAVGQYVVGFALTWLVLGPLFGTPAIFGCLIEVGFSGGHGTASAMAPVFTDLGFPAGAVLGQMAATVGLVVGVVGGVWLIQWGARRGHTHVLPRGALAVSDSSGLLPAGARPSIATGTVSPVVIEPFTLHVAAIGLALLAGTALLEALRNVHPMFDAFPLFPLAMLGGMAVQSASVRLGIDGWFDRASFQRLSGLALDLLVTSAVASMRLDLFAQHLAPFVLLMVVAIVWCVASFVWLAPRLLPEDWFEQGLVVYGTQTGVAAVGLMLLRIADPEQQTTAARAFAARSVVISPLLGGGLLTAAMPLLVTQFGLAPLLAAVTVVTAGAWFWPGRRAATR